MSSSLLATARHLLFAIVLALPLAAARPAAALDLTDIWWNFAESGWGVNFIQADNFIFATFFFYGPAKEPTWVTGQMTQGANGVWNGPLYATTGSYFGGPWNVADRTTTQVGSVTFTPTNAYSGVLTYNVGPTVVTKIIARQTLKIIPLGGEYSGALISILANCNDPANNGPLRLFNDLSVTQTSGGALTFDFAFSGGNCSVSGSFIQEGQYYRVPGAGYSCAGGTTFTAQVTQIKATNQGIEGQWVAPVGAGCVETAYFSAVLQ